MRFALRIAYDGTAFYGFQRQPDVRTVEGGELIRVLSKLGGVISDAGGSSNFKGASRTDRGGVSAFFNVVAFDTENRPTSSGRRFSTTT